MAPVTPRLPRPWSTRFRRRCSHGAAHSPACVPSGAGGGPFNATSCGIFVVGTELTLSRAIYAALLSLSPDVPRRPVSGSAVLDGEAAALEALEPMATAIGKAPADRDAYEPALGAQAYSAYLAWLSLWQ